MTMTNQAKDSDSGIKMNVYVFAIIMFSIYMGLFFNLHKAGKYYRENVGTYHFNNKFNTVMGYFITVGKAPLKGAKLVSYVNPCSWGQKDSFEKKYGVSRAEALRRAKEEYLRNTRNK